MELQPLLHVAFTVNVLCNININFNISVFSHLCLALFKILPQFLNNIMFCTIRCLSVSSFLILLLLLLLLLQLLLQLLQSALQPLWVLACSTIFEYSQQEGFYRVPLPAARQTPQLEGPVIRTFQLPPPGVPQV